MLRCVDLAEIDKRKRMMHTETWECLGYSKPQAAGSQQLARDLAGLCLTAAQGRNRKRQKTTK